MGFLLVAAQGFHQDLTALPLLTSVFAVLESIYLTNGSHGCVNLPSKKAEVIYGYVEQGEPVIVYGGQVSVPRTEEKQEQPEVTVPEENITPELTPEQACKTALLSAHLPSFRQTTVFQDVRQIIFSF